MKSTVFLILLALPLSAGQLSVREKQRAEAIINGCNPDTEYWMTMPGGMAHCMALPPEPAADQQTPSEDKGFIMAHGQVLGQYTADLGNRGSKAFSLPNWAMVTVHRKYQGCNAVEVEAMVTGELYTMPREGMPQLFQVGEAHKDGKPYVDFQHPHKTPVMGLKLGQIFNLGGNCEKTLRVSFAPRGEAPFGPVSFMHREFGYRPPLFHHGTDATHITRGGVYIGGVYFKRFSLEGGVFSGREDSPEIVNLNMSKPDTAAARFNFMFNEGNSIGASFLKGTATHEGVIAVHEHHEDGPRAPHKLVDESHPQTGIAAWMHNRSANEKRVIDHNLIYGQIRNEYVLNGIIDEIVIRMRRHNWAGRVEFVQRNDKQLEVHVIDDLEKVRWMASFNLLYEYKMFSRQKIQGYLGASATAYNLPEAWAEDYKGAGSFTGFFRITFGGTKRITSQ